MEQLLIRLKRLNLTVSRVLYLVNLKELSKYLRQGDRNVFRDFFYSDDDNEDEDDKSDYVDDDEDN